MLRDVLDFSAFNNALRNNLGGCGCGFGGLGGLYGRGLWGGYGYGGYGYGGLGYGYGGYGWW